MGSKSYYAVALILWTPTCVFSADPVLFAYFQEPAKSGVHFALSEDGYRFEPLKSGKPWIPPQHAGELMRDPFLTRGPDGEFHMVWTWEWRSQSIGYAHSKDLIHWSEQSQIPLFPAAKNVWAPEIYWDAGKASWLVIWSSVVEGRNDTNRIYYAFTKDFRTFSKPEIFFDPGYQVIDATILQTKGKYWLIFKDERPEPLHKEIKIAQGPSLQGPWAGISEGLTESWSEGPSVLDLGERYVIYYDHYREPRRYEAIGSKDLKEWMPINELMSFPANCKHGSFLRITPEEARRLQAAN